MATTPFQFLFILLLALALLSGNNAAESKKAVPFGKRNIGGHFKDWYLSKMTKNYFCTVNGRLVPVDPRTGHMLLKNLRKRGIFDAFDEPLGHSAKTETGSCRNPTWVLPQGWTQPIPVTQFLAQYPWMDVDERGQMQLKPDYRAWLEQQGELRQQQAAQGGGQAVEAGGATGAAAGGVVQDGGVGYVPPSFLNVGTGMATSSGLGGNNFGNGVAAGSAAHV
ncbi:uncharacterized protein UHOD_03606 [Ustilago sp. UG-2017b]|nr:uncharacterized protein UHOD_03606 [Ustilago sp. UG-2017b]